MLTQPLNHPYSVIVFRAAAALSNSWSILPFLSAGCFQISQLSETEAGQLSLRLVEVGTNALPQHSRGCGLCFSAPSVSQEAQVSAKSHWVSFPMLLLQASQLGLPEKQTWS